MKSKAQLADDYASMLQKRMADFSKTHPDMTEYQLKTILLDTFERRWLNQYKEVSP